MSNRRKPELGWWHEYDILPGDQTLYIGSHYEDEGGDSGVDFAMAEKVIKNLHILDKTTHTNGITIKMNNPGGCSIHGLAIYDAIQTCNNHVTMIGYGHIMSMGSVIFQAGDTRVMAPHARMMLHMGQMGLQTETNNFYANVDEYKKLDEFVLNIYLKRIKEKRPRFTKAQLKTKMATDWYLGPREAIDMGLCDRILE